MTASTQVHTQPEDTRVAAWAALSAVYDPELDEPVTDLGFVAELAVDGGTVSVRLRLPTYFCAPNFAYLMVADAHDAVAAVPGVEAVAVRLDDHFASAEINAGMAAGSGFADTFDGLTEQHSDQEELGELRRTFWRKAHLACIDRIARQMIGDGWEVDELADVTLGQLPQSANLDRLLRRRRDLQLPTGDEAPLLVDQSGQRIRTDQLPAHLRFARTVRVSLDANASFCREVLRSRYGTAADSPRPNETTTEGDKQR